MKQARLEAGLSLAQLGRGHVTAPAIYLIETGRTRPSLPTLEHISRRTGKPVEFFLAEPSLGVDQSVTNLSMMAAMVAEGRNEEAIELGRWLLEEGASAVRLGRIRFLLAQAYLGSSRPELAEQLLAEARAHFEAINDRPMLAETLGLQAALATARHPKEAVELARKAVEICAGLSPRPLPVEARLLAILGAAQLADHDVDAAIETYAEAVEAARPLIDPRRAAAVYSQLGAEYRQAGEVEAASRYVGRSIAVLEALRDRVSLARAENNLGLALLERGDLASAHEHLNRALELSDGSDVEFGRAGVLLGLAQLSLQEGDLEAAGGLARQALDWAERHEDAANQAEAHIALGRIASLRGDSAASDQEFELAIHGFEALGMHDRLLHIHGVYADVLERRGELAKAYLHMKHALQASRPRAARRQEEEKVSSA